MKVQGRYGTFTPRPDQAPIYASRAKKQREQQAQQTRGLAEWLEQHKVCANGCGKPVAFYDTVNYALKHGGCCSAECEAAHDERLANERAARITVHAGELHGALELVLFTDRIVRQHKGKHTEMYRDAVRENNQAVEAARDLMQRIAHGTPPSVDSAAGTGKEQP